MDFALFDTDLDSVAMKDFVTDWIRFYTEASANLKVAYGISPIIVQKRHII